MLSSRTISAAVATLVLFTSAAAFAEVADKMPSLMAQWKSLGTAAFIAVIIGVLGRRSRAAGLMLAVLSGIGGALLVGTGVQTAMSPLGDAIRVELGEAYLALHVLWPLPYLLASGYLLWFHLACANDEPERPSDG